MTEVEIIVAIEGPPSQSRHTRLVAVGVAGYERRMASANTARTPGTHNNAAGRSRLFEDGSLCWIRILDLNLRNLRDLAELLYDPTQRASSVKVYELDLSHLKIVLPTTLPFLVSWAQAQSARRKRVRVILPEDRRAAAYVQRMCLEAAFRNEVPQDEPPEDAVNLPLSLFSCTDRNSGFEHSKRIVSFLARAGHLPEATEQALLTLFAELLENAVAHSGWAGNGSYAATLHPSSGKLSVAVSDPGMGILESFLSGYSEGPKARIARGSNPIDLAVEPLSSSKFGRGHSGYGLAFTRNLVALNRGSLFITSGRDTVSYFGAREASRHAPAAGTFIAVLLDLSRPINSRAAWDAVRPYEDGPNYHAVKWLKHGRAIALGEYGQRIVSRQHGASIRGRLLEVIESHAAVNIDLTGVNVITPSAADEIFGQLFTDLGRTEFERRVGIAGADDYQQYLVELVLSHRIAFASRYTRSASTSGA